MSGLVVIDGRSRLADTPQTRLEQRGATIVLLETRTAWHPSTPSQWARFGAVPGESPTARRDCKSCGGTGEVNGRQGREPCVKCDGQGWYLVDAYTGFRSTDEGAGKAVLTKSEKDAQTVAEIARMRSQTAPPRTEADLLAAANLLGERWERDRDRHHEHGSYAELERALERLGHESFTARQLVEWTYCHHIIDLTDGLRHAAQTAVDYMNRWMPNPVRVPAWYRPKHPALARRDRKRDAA